MALQTEFHELVALALGVVDWEVCFGLAVGGADHVCWLVDAALELSLNELVAGKGTGHGIWYLCSRLDEGQDRLDRYSGHCRFLRRHCMCSMTETVRVRHYSRGGQTYTIESIKERVEQVGSRHLLWLVKLVVDLIQSHRLGVDQCIALDTLAFGTGPTSDILKVNHSRHVNINVRFAGVQRAVRRHGVVGTINQGWNGISALRNPWRILLVEEVEI